LQPLKTILPTILTLTKEVNCSFTHSEHFDIQNIIAETYFPYIVPKFLTKSGNWINLFRNSQRFSFVFSSQVHLYNECNFETVNTAISTITLEISKHNFNIEENNMRLCHELLVLCYFKISSVLQCTILQRQRMTISF
jgi:hypothetical protein